MLLVLLVALAVTAGMLILATEINDAFSDAGAVLDTHATGASWSRTSEYSGCVRWGGPVSPDPPSLRTNPG